MNIESLFGRSYQRVLTKQVDGQVFFEAFYAVFVATPDWVADKFKNTDMERQQAIFRKAFYHLLSFYASNSTDYYLDQVAISHNRKNLDIRPELYDLRLETLIATVRRFNNQLRRVSGTGIVYMKFHYGRTTIVGTSQPKLICVICL